MDGPINIDDLVRERDSELAKRRLDRIECYGTASVEELAEGALEHYKTLSAQANWYNSVVPAAIVSWVRERSLALLLEEAHSATHSTMQPATCLTCKLLAEVRDSWGQRYEDRRG